MGQTISACRAVPCHSLPGKQLDQAGLQLAESSLISKQFREGLLRCTCLAVFLEAIRARSSCPSTSLFSAMPQQCLLAAPSVCTAGCQPACWPRLLTCGWGSWLLSSWKSPTSSWGGIWFRVLRGTAAEPFRNADAGGSAGRWDPALPATVLPNIC